MCRTHSTTCLKLRCTHSTYLTKNLKYTISSAQSLREAAYWESSSRCRSQRNTSTATVKNACRALRQQINNNILIYKWSTVYVAHPTILSNLHRADLVAKPWLLFISSSLWGWSIRALASLSDVQNITTSVRWALHFLLQFVCDIILKRWLIIKFDNFYIHFVDISFLK